MPDFNSVDFTGYSNFVVQNEIKSALATKLDLTRFCTTNYSLTAAPGMTVKVHKYTVAPGSEVQFLDRAAGNTKNVSSVMSESEYTVKRLQGTFQYYDDDILADEMLIQAKAQHTAEEMTNAINRAAIGEMVKTENILECTAYDEVNFANLISLYTARYESTEGLFFLLNQKLDAKVRKLFSDHLQYSEGYLKIGALYAIFGIPCFYSREIPENYVVLATREAVTNFIKRDISLETERVPNTHLTNNFVSTYSIIALTDETRVAVMAPAQASNATITSPVAGDTAIAGTGTEAGLAVAYVNGKKVGQAVISSGAYSIPCDALVKDEAVKVIVSVEGKANKIATAVVAAE